MSAIVLDHEQAYEKAGSRHGEHEAEPIAPRQGRPRQYPQNDKWTDGDQKLNDAA
jgi:hypothetical protein